MATTEKTGQNDGQKQVEVPTYFYGLEVRSLRNDVDEAFCISKLGDSMEDSLKAFAERQIITCPDEIFVDDVARSTLLNGLHNGPQFVDSVARLITSEPCLMLSNLTIKQLIELDSVMRGTITETNFASISSAICNNLSSPILA